MTKPKLYEEREGLDATSVECPTCFAWEGWACGDAHCDGSHKERIKAAEKCLGRSYAPWNDDQVSSLNEYQGCERFHPFTGPRGSNGEETVLLATTNGWVTEAGGPVVQLWAHTFMADGSWKKAP